MANEKAKLTKIAYSPQWLKLLHYKKNSSGYSSQALQQKFFFAKNGKSNPLLELKATLKAFRNSKKIQTHPRCLFPARFELLSRYWKDLNPKATCPELSDWLKNIDAGELFLVFSSTYHNNPGSIFGHTFLRFNRKSKTEFKTSKELLGYSIAFQALTDPRDNAIVYTYKGITGGYQSYLEIKPHYVNVGMYNNAESRDLWEYPIPLSEQEKIFLLKHIWEIIQHTNFPYYFFDENCSTYVLELLESIRPEWNFKTKKNLFVIPQLTLQEIVSTTGADNFSYRPAIMRLILARFDRLSFKERKQVMLAKKGALPLNELKNVDQLDLLIDFWKFKTYKKNGQLNKKDKLEINNVLLARSKNPSVLKEVKLTNRNKDKAPHLAHKFHRLQLQQSKKKFLFKIRYAVHSFDDLNLGFDEKSYIEFFQLQLEKEKSQNSLHLTQFDFLEITSLQDFYWHLPQISWNIKSWFTQTYLPKNERQFFNLSGAIGFAQLHQTLQFYLLSGANLEQEIGKNATFLIPEVKSGAKKIFGPSLWMTMYLKAQYVRNKDKQSLNLKAFYQNHRAWRFGFTSFKSLNSKEIQSAVNLSYYF